MTPKNTPLETIILTPTSAPTAVKEANIDKVLQIDLSEDADEVESVDKSVDKSADDSANKSADDNAVVAAASDTISAEAAIDSPMSIASTPAYNSILPVARVPLEADGSGEAGSTTYTIENERFGINNTGSNARQTTDGINTALNWAKEQGYKTIKFVKGTYMIQCKWRNRYIAPTDGILVPSGLTLDLGNSTFMMETNDYPEYTIFGIVNQTDVTIKNGTLIGDLDTHVFKPNQASPTHEFGFGIVISASRNVLIQGVTIKKMTGDGIIIEGSYSKLSDGGSVSSRVRILDCVISNCRRQGISVIGARDSEIARNEIFNIRGTAPEYGIDLESELDYVIDNIKVHSNKIYDCAGGAITCHSGTDFEVYSNLCIGTNILAVFSSHVKIYNNTIQNSFIHVMSGASNITVTDNILDENSWLRID
jgi:parallel beta-helix repeat protein